MLPNSRAGFPHVKQVTRRHLRKIPRLAHPTIHSRETASLLSGGHQPAADTRPKTGRLYANRSEDDSGVTENRRVISGLTTEANRPAVLA